MGMHRDQSLVVEGHHLVQEDMVIVLLRVKDQCWFGLVRFAEALLQKSKDVCALRMQPGHGLQCGGLCGVCR